MYLENLGIMTLKCFPNTQGRNVYVIFGNFLVIFGSNSLREKKRGHQWK